MNDGCDECEMWRQKGASFCPICGSRLDKPPERPVFDMLVLLGVTAVAFIILYNAAYIAYNFGGICGELDGARARATISLGLWSVQLFEYGGLWLEVVLILDVLIEVACVLYGLWRLYTLLQERPEDYPAQATAGISIATAALAISLFVSLIGIILSALLGQAPDTSWINDYSTYLIVYLVTHAGVSEELMFRVLFIGFPMAIIALILNRDKRSWQYLLGGFGMSKIAVVLIVFSSVLFGLAHYNGWGWSKVPITFFGGIVFAYVYTEYGLYASIIMHTANDTLLTLTYGGLSLLSVVAEFSLMILGAIVMIYWILHPNREVLDFKNMQMFPEKLEHNLIEQWKRH